MVITIWVIPSSSAAARATSAICWGDLTATVAPERRDSSIAQNRQRSCSSYLTQVCTTVVARTLLECRRAIFS